MTRHRTRTMETISRVCQHPGPFLSAYLNVSRDVDEAPHRLAVRWRSAREELLRMEAPGDVVDAVGERVLDPVSAPGHVHRMIVATGEQILLDDVVVRPRTDEVVNWGPLPDLTHWLADQSAKRPALVVLVDREGADFELYDAWPEKPVSTDSMHGDTEHLTKVAGGEYAHKQYQRRAEWTWRRNAEDVAAEVERRVRAGVPHVIVAGDLRAQGELRNALSEEARAILVELETGGRSPGTSREALDHAIDETLRTVVVTEHLRVVHEFEEEAGRDGAAAGGLAEVLPALVAGRVRTVLMAPDVARSHQVKPAEHPGLQLPRAALAHDDARADLVVLAAAAATDAEVLLGPRSVADDGVAAVLRW